jgi:hypothetical protein
MSRTSVAAKDPFVVNVAAAFLSFAVFAAVICGALLTHFDAPASIYATRPAALQTPVRVAP